MSQFLQALKDAGQDFEWYPTTERMVDAVVAELRDNTISSFLDVGAGDGRVLAWLRVGNDHADLFAIEKAPLLMQAQPEHVTPVGTDFYEQDLMSLPVDVVFSNPPYSEYEAWASRIIETAHARMVFLILPQRWSDSAVIAGALKSREAVARVIHHDDFYDAERRARAVVDVLLIEYPGHEHRHGSQDPFDVWFDQNINTFDAETEVSEHEQERRDLARLHHMDSIPDLVAAFNEDYDRLQDNYKAIFRLDYALLKELGVDKHAVRAAMKQRMKGLKNTYWQALFEHLDVITSRLSTKTKNHFLRRITAQSTVAFTESNAYTVVLWAIKFANRYFDQQVTDLFRELSTHEGVSNYKSNQRTWQKDGWRYAAESFSHYALDYRIVKHHFQAIPTDSWHTYDSPGGLHKSCHELLDDLVAVFGNLGFPTPSTPSRVRVWRANAWQDFRLADGRTLFQVKGFQNGNLHFRFMPDAIKALNIEAGRILGWLRAGQDVVDDLGYTHDEAQQFFGCNQRIGNSAVRLLSTPAQEGK